MGLMGLMGLMGCSSEDTEERMSYAPVEVMGMVAEYEDIHAANETNEAHAAHAAQGFTRAWVPPSGYSLFDEGKSISVFFTQTDVVPAEGFEEEFFFKSSDKWRVSKTDLMADTYYLYGYMPYDPSITPTVSVLPGDGKTFADGAVLTLANLPTVTPNDLCVMIGAKNGKDDYKANEDYTVTGLKRGDFAYQAELTEAVGETPKGSNYIYLLFDHLYASLQLNINVYKKYDDLRTIKLKELRLQTYTGDTPMKRKMNASVTLTANDEGNDPISSITFTGNGTIAGKDLFYQKAGGETLGTAAKAFVGYFCPNVGNAGVTKLVLTSTYDVYDKNVDATHPDGNLIRENCEATNVLVLNDVFKEETTTRRGYRYNINLTIQPTYLYMLSEPDLDNPTVVVN